MRKIVKREHNNLNHIPRTFYSFKKIVPNEAFTVEENASVGNSATSEML